MLVDSSKVMFKIDIGRLAIIPIFVLLLIFNILSFYKHLTALSPLSLMGIMRSANNFLLIYFYVLGIILYFFRKPAKSTSKSFIANTVAVIALFLPFAFSFMGGQPYSLMLILMSNFMIVAGMVLSVCSLSILGRSFSIIPQARSLVQVGPYGFVRHPLYLGELICVFGIALSKLSILAVAIFLLFAVFQVYRALQEEKVLADVFPEYEEYKLRTSRFLPSLF